METQKSDLKYYIHCAVMLLFFFGFGYVPPLGTITEVGMQVLGIFLGLIYGWMFIDMLWPSLLGMIALGMSDYANSVTSIFASGIGNKNVILVLFFFMFSQYLEHSGLSRTVAMKLLTMKALKGRPWMMFWMLLFVPYLLGIFINTYAVIFLCWTFIYDICTLAGYEKKSSLAAAALVGTVQMAGISGTVMPYQVFPSLCINALTSTTGLTVGTGQFILFNLIISFLGCLGYFLACRYIIKIDASKLGDVNESTILKGEALVYDTQQKIATGVLVAFLVIALSASFLPAGNVLKTLYGKLGDQGLLMLVVVFAAAVKIKGKPLANPSDLINKGVTWSLMFLLMATFVVGDAVKADQCGIITQISATLTPIFSNLSGVMFLVVSFITLGLITQVAHNLVLATVFVPILSTLAIDAGLGETIAILVALGLAVVLLMALVTPAASNRGALIFGSDWIGTHNAFVFGATACSVAIGIVIIVGIPLGFLLF